MGCHTWGYIPVESAKKYYPKRYEDIRNHNTGIYFQYKGKEYVDMFFDAYYETDECEEFWQFGRYWIPPIELEECDGMIKSASEYIELAKKDGHIYSDVNGEKAHGLTEEIIIAVTKFYERFPDGLIDFG